MKNTPRTSRASVGAAVVSVALSAALSVALSAAPAATAAAAGPPTASRAAAEARPPAPALTSASVKGDTVRLLWKPAAGGGVAGYAVYADRSFVHRTSSPDSDTIFLTSEGLSGREAYTIVAEDGAGGQSPPSNAMTPRPVVALPAPKLTGAVLDDDAVTLTWIPSRTDEASGEITYFVYADRSLTMSTRNATGVRVPLSQGPFVLSGREVFTVVAWDRTMADSPPSNGLIPTRP